MGMDLFTSEDGIEFDLTRVAVTLALVPPPRKVETISDISIVLSRIAPLASANASQHGILTEIRQGRLIVSFKAMPMRIELHTVAFEPIYLILDVPGDERSRARKMMLDLSRVFGSLKQMSVADREDATKAIFEIFYKVVLCGQHGGDADSWLAEDQVDRVLVIFEAFNDRVEIHAVKFDPVHAPDHCGFFILRRLGFPILCAVPASDAAPSAYRNHSVPLLVVDEAYSAVRARLSTADVLGWLGGQAGEMIAHSGRVAHDVGIAVIIERFVADRIGRSGSEAAHSVRHARGTEIYVDFAAAIGMPIVLPAADGVTAISGKSVVKRLMVQSMIDAARGIMLGDLLPDDLLPADAVVAAISAVRGADKDDAKPSWCGRNRKAWASSTKVVGGKKDERRASATGGIKVSACVDHTLVVCSKDDGADFEAFMVRAIGMPITEAVGGGDAEALSLDRKLMKADVDIGCARGMPVILMSGFGIHADPVADQEMSSCSAMGDTIATLCKGSISTGSTTVGVQGLRP